MMRCPQCGADLRLAEEELHPTCPFCATSFRLQDFRPARRLWVPPGTTPAQLRQAVRDHLARAGQPPGAEPALQTFHLPFLLRADGRPEPAFATHVPELARFRLPGSDWKVFDEAAVAADDVVVEPSLAGEPAEGEAVVHYPVCRAALARHGGEVVLWLDAYRGTVLAGDLVPLRARGDGAVARRLLTVSAAVFLVAMAALPFPWSAGAALAASPLLYRWGMRRLREAP